MANNTAIAKGTLNRIRCSVVLPNNPSLNIISSQMGKSMARVTFEGQLVNQIPTATGVVNSPEPYVMVTITIALLRTTPLAAAWLAQLLADSNIQDATVYSDTAAFPPIALEDVVINHFDPGPYDGSSPDTPLVLRGALPVNNNLWTY